MQSCVRLSLRYRHLTAREFAVEGLTSHAEEAYLGEDHFATWHVPDLSSLTAIGIFQVSCVLWWIACSNVHSNSQVTAPKLVELH
jgi:hypothetical protein